MTIDELNERFGIDGAAEFAAGRGGLTKLAISADGGAAEVYLLGANVAHYQPAGGEAVLWLSDRSQFAQGMPIRGGVPICHPWFAANDQDPGAPMHGFARLMEWDLADVRQAPGGEVTVEMTMQFGRGSMASWPGDFRVRYAVTVGRSLRMALETRNLGEQPLTITEALHTYLRVADVRGVSVRGLEGAAYFDKVAGRRTTQADEPVTFTGETDRAYLDTVASCMLDDPGMDRSILVAKTGSNSTVVWNPWTDKARRMDDFGDDEWPGMVCVETANVLDDAVVIPPGESREMVAVVSAAPLGAELVQPVPRPARRRVSAGKVDDWTELTARICVEATPAAVFEAWATQAGLARWLVESAWFRPAGSDAGRADGAARAGDEFLWSWRTAGPGTAGRVVEASWPERLVLAFGQAGRCAVTITRQPHVTMVEVVESGLAGPADYAAAATRWTFALTNLKSVLEGGLDLRETDITLPPVVNG